jgi:peptidoglycan-N-acetylglucosamine deacetylase
MKNRNIYTLLFIISIVFVHHTTVFAQGNAGFHLDKSFNVVPNDKNANKKIVLITIDDGPSKNSSAFADVLKKHNAHAIFFVNGMHDKPNTGALAKIYNGGNPIGNHTWNHANLKKIAWKKAQKEIDDDTMLIKKITGQNPHFFRPPYGVSTPQVRAYVEKNNMIFMNWSGSVKDWEKTAKVEDVYMKNVTKDIHNGENILLHEHDWSVAYFDALLSQLEKDGYSFVDPNEIH